MVDLKYDNCHIPWNWWDWCNGCSESDANASNGTCWGLDYCSSTYDYSQSNSAKRYTAMRDALVKQNRTILYSICEWGTAGVETWGNNTGHSWRSTQDIKREFPFESWHISGVVMTDCALL